MSSKSSYEWRKQLMWGLFLIAIGVIFLLDRLDLFEMNGLWHYWPLALVILGVNRMIGYPSAKNFVNGLWMVFFGLWIFAVLEGLFGLTFQNAWPLPVIFCGVTMIIEPFVQKRLAANTESGHEK